MWPAVLAALRMSRTCAVAETAAAPPKPAASGSKPVPSYVSVSENYAVIDVGGVQHLVEEGRWYTCNRLNVRFCLSQLTTVTVLRCCPNLLVHLQSAQNAAASSGDNSYALAVPPVSWVHLQLAQCVAAQLRCSLL